MKHSLWSLAWIRHALYVTVIFGVVVIMMLHSEKRAVFMASTAAALQSEGRLPDLGGAIGWLNSAPLNTNDLSAQLLRIQGGRVEPPDSPTQVRQATFTLRSGGGARHEHS